MTDRVPLSTAGADNRASIETRPAADASGRPLEPYIEQARELFQRHPNNPILQPRDMPFSCKSVCNPGACLFEGDVLLLLRVIDEQGRSRIYAARSRDGVTDWRVEETPLLSPEVDSAWYDNQGCEDPRITFVEERGEYIITYVGFSRFGSGVCLASTKDFRTATRLGMVMHPYNKDASLFPRRIGGKYYLLHRPTAGPLENIWISESDDLLHWGDPRCVLEEEDQPGWDSGKVGAGPTPIETEHGWLLIFHGVKQVDGGWEYRVGIAMLHKDDPTKIIYRWPEWVLSPDAPYESAGAKPGIIFPTGSVVLDDTFYVYYGAADTCIALVTVKRELLRSFREEVAPLLNGEGR